MVMEKQFYVHHIDDAWVDYTMKMAVFSYNIPVSVASLTRKNIIPIVK
jgi:hypothetical protein